MAAPRVDEMYTLFPLVLGGPRVSAQTRLFPLSGRRARAALALPARAAPFILYTPVHSPVYVPVGQETPQAPGDLNAPLPPCCDSPHGDGEHKCAGMGAHSSPLSAWSSDVVSCSELDTARTTADEPEDASDGESCDGKNAREQAM